MALSSCLLNLPNGNDDDDDDDDNDDDDDDVDCGGGGGGDGDNVDDVRARQLIPRSEIEKCTEVMEKRPTKLFRKIEHIVWNAIRTQFTLLFPYFVSVIIISKIRQFRFQQRNVDI